MRAEGCLKLAADTGAGRRLVFSQASECQGIHDASDRFMSRQVRAQGSPQVEAIAIRVMPLA